MTGLDELVGKEFGGHDDSENEKKRSGELIEDEKEFLRQNGVNGNGNGKKKNGNGENNKAEDEELRLAQQEKLTSQDIAFVINTMKKEAPHDGMSIRQLFYGMISAFTKNPIPHNVNSKDPGAGKSYLLNLVASYFPQKYVIALAGMSDKAILHRNGIMVREKKNTADSESDVVGQEEEDDEVEPISPIIANLELQIENLEEQIEEEKAKKESSNKSLIRDNTIKIKEAEAEIKEIQNNAEKLIDLSNQIILILDTPQASLFDSLMSLMSQDTQKDQKYSFVEKSGAGPIRTKVNRLRGMPVLFTAQVIDDTRNTRFQEKNRRFINVTPDTSSLKIGTANDAIGLRYGSLPEEYDQLVVSRQDKERAKHILKILIEKLKQHSKSFQPKESGVKIPFVDAITHSIPSDQVWSMTVCDRIMKYLSIIAKVNMDSRPRIVNKDTGRFYPIATFEDLKETLLLMERGASGVRPYIVKWYNDVFLSAFKDLDGKPIELKSTNGSDVTIESETHVGVSTELLAVKTKEILGCSKPSSGDLLHKYLYPLLNQGIIDEIQSKIDGRRNIYFPVEEGEGNNNLFSLFEDLDNPRLIVSKPGIFPTIHILEQSFRFSLDYLSDGGCILEKNFASKKYKLVDINGTEITVDRLLDKYFSNNSVEDCFIKDYTEQAVVLANFALARVQTSALAKTPYEKIIFFHTPLSTNILSGFSNNKVEEKSSEILYNGSALSTETIQTPKVSQNDHQKPNTNNDSDNPSYRYEANSISSCPPTITYSPIIAIEEFFDNKPDSLDQPLPPHALEQSPCHTIIGLNNNYKITLYFCKLHPDMESAHLEFIEHHCKYKDPDKHKAEILRLLREKVE